MSKLQHENLVGLEGIMLSPLRLAIEYCPKGDLHKLLASSVASSTNLKAVALSWRTKVKLLLDIARGLTHLHAQRPPIIHRDLRSPNVFLTEEINQDTGLTELQAKVGDFGTIRNLSNQTRPDQINPIHSIL